jgi:tRNA pseudouridine38-40 synthase
MARYQIILSYDGTDFHGFQRQGSTRTVQLEVENTLRKVGWQGKSIFAAGRTDSGVHASGQVIAFDLEWSHPVETLGKALNAFLPPDIGVQKVSEAPARFHPRFDACWRTYQYCIYFQPFRDPLQDRFAWRIWPELDVQLLEQAAGLFIGEHDFSAFGSPMKPGGSTIRTVSSSTWLCRGGCRFYLVKANAFLYHMVRRVVFAQTQYALGKIELGNLERGLIDGEPMPPGMAPANGLNLYEVGFQDGISGDKVNSES